MNPRHPPADPACPRCRGEGYQVERDGERAVARLCDCVGVCPLCHGSGFVAVEEGFRAPRRRCACQALDHKIRLFQVANLPGRHATSTRESFQPGSARQTAVLGAVTGWINNYRPGGENRGIVLYGAVGRGKTHLISALLRELVFRHGVSVAFVEFSHLLADLKGGFDRGEGAAARLDPLVKVEVLAIDELGKGRNTEFEGTIVDELVSRRYNAGKPILGTTNYEPEAARGLAAPNLAGGAAPSLPDRVGPRVYSRLEEMCDFVEVPGEDFRTKLREDRRPARGRAAPKIS